MLYMTPQGGTITVSPKFWGIIKSPRSWSPPPAGYLWCGDNDAFSGGFDKEAFYDWLERSKPYRKNCIFVAAPDVIADPAATIEQYLNHAPRIRGLGYHVAFVAQDGQEDLPFPMNFDALFIGGVNEMENGVRGRYLYTKRKGDG